MPAGIGGDTENETVVRRRKVLEEGKEGRFPSLLYADD